MMKAEKPRTKSEDIMPFTIGAKRSNITNNFFRTDLIMTQKPDAKSADIMPLNRVPERSNEIKNRYVNVDDYAGIEETRGMENLNNCLKSDSSEIITEINVRTATFAEKFDTITEKSESGHTNAGVIVEGLDEAHKIQSSGESSDLKSESTEIIKDIDVCPSTCVDKTCDITEKAESGHTNAGVIVEGLNEAHKIQSSGESSDLKSESTEIIKDSDVCPSTCVDKSGDITEKAESGHTNACVIVEGLDEAHKIQSSGESSDTKEAVTVRKRHKGYRKRPIKAVQQHTDSSGDKSKSMVAILKLTLKEACMIFLAFLFVFCKLVIYKYTGFMMMLTVIRCENIPRTSLSLRLDGAEIVHGKTIVLKCTTHRIRRLCDINKRSRRWTKGREHIPLITNGKSVNDSKFEEYVNGNCTQLELRIKDINERDVNVEYNLEYGFELATYNLTIRKSKFKKYPINQTALIDIQCINGNLTLWLMFDNINPIPNCTVKLQDTIFPLNIADVNETVFFYDVVYMLTNLLECDECKGEVHIKCRCGTAFEFDQTTTYNCSSGTTTENNLSLLLTAMQIVLPVAVCTALVISIFCCFQLRRHKKNERSWILFKLLHLRR